MTRLDVHFANGRDVLNAYWGYLSGGGLTIPRTESGDDLREGEDLVLHVHIGTRCAFSVQGTVVRVLPEKTVIAFEERETQSRLLTAALAERDIDMEALLRVGDLSDSPVTRGRLFVLSEDGCCLRLGPDASAALDVGTRVAIDSPSFRIAGYVILANECDRCILFGMSDTSAIEAVRAYVRAAS